MVKPFRFGVQVKTAATGAQWVDRARKIESLGYSTMTMPDHFDDQVGTIAGLATAAAVTENLRVGALVWCNDYRHPMILAQELASIDLLSNGRLEFGLGAGWMRTDYDEGGLTYDRPGVRIDRMLEAIEVYRGLFSGEEFSFNGDYYTITNHVGAPKPVQDHVPLLIGGGGPRMLKLAGRHADIVGVNPNLQAGVIDAATGQDATAERYAEKVGWVRDGAGDRFDDIELQVRVFFTVLTDDRQGTAAAMAPGLGLTAEQALDSPLALVGTPAEIADDLRQRRERYGFSYIIVGEEVTDAFAPVVAELAGS